MDVDAPVAQSKSGEAEGAVRGGQLFGHLAGRGGGGSGGYGGYGSGDDSADHFVGYGMSRGDSGGSELSGVSFEEKACARRPLLWGSGEFFTYVRALDWLVCRGVVAWYAAQGRALHFSMSLSMIMNRHEAETTTSSRCVRHIL